MRSWWNAARKRRAPHAWNTSFGSRMLEMILVQECFFKCLCKSRNESDCPSVHRKWVPGSRVSNRPTQGQLVNEISRHNITLSMKPPYHLSLPQSSRAVAQHSARFEQIRVGAASGKNLLLAQIRKFKWADQSGVDCTSTTSNILNMWGLSFQSLFLWVQ